MNHKEVLKILIAICCKCKASPDANYGVSYVITVYLTQVFFKIMVTYVTGYILPYLINCDTSLTEVTMLAIEETITDKRYRRGIPYCGRKHTLIVFSGFYLSAVMYKFLHLLQLCISYNYTASNLIKNANILFTKKTCIVLTACNA